MSSLDRVITLQRRTETKDDLGVVSEAWAPIGTLRASLVQEEDTEDLKPSGLQADGSVTFRTRWLGGLTVRDRLLYDGAPHDILVLREIGRRRGLEIRAIARGQA